MTRGRPFRLSRWRAAGAGAADNTCDDHNICNDEGGVACPRRLVPLLAMLCVALTLGAAGSVAGVTWATRAVPHASYRLASAFSLIRPVIDGDAPPVQPAWKRNIGIVQLADAEFQKKQPLQYAAVRAYANFHGYEYHLIDPITFSPSCARRHDSQSFFFLKHCAVADFLQQRRSRREQQLRNAQPMDKAAALDAAFTAVVLDGDTVPAGGSASSLDRWLAPWRRDEGTTAASRSASAKYFSTSSDALRLDDLTFYLRSWNFEVMAGNYIARSTPFAIQFLRTWADYGFVIPKGFSSADNGAIHLVLLQALGIPAPACVRAYESLVALSDDLRSYFEFVGCTRRAMGPASRRWEVGHRESVWGFTESAGWGKESIQRAAEADNDAAILIQKEHHPRGGKEKKEGTSSASNHRNGAGGGGDGGIQDGALQLSSQASRRHRITVWPRYHSFALDGYLQDFAPGGMHPLHHGVKNPEQALGTYKFDFHFQENRSSTALKKDETKYTRAGKPGDRQEAAAANGLTSGVEEPVACATEGQFCACLGKGSRVRFGNLPDKFTEWVEASAFGKHSVTHCNVEAFGGTDPDPGKKKICQCASLKSWEMREKWGALWAARLAETQAARHAEWKRCVASHDCRLSSTEPTHALDLKAQAKTLVRAEAFVSGTKWSSARKPVPASYAVPRFDMSQCMAHGDHVFGCEPLSMLQDPKTFEGNEPHETFSKLRRRHAWVLPPYPTQQQED